MIYRRKRVHSAIPGGFVSVEEEGSHTRLFGSGFGDHIRLRDEHGNQWRGSAEKSADETVRYTFRDAMGRTISGVADGFGLILRDSHGKMWRGVID